MTHSKRRNIGIIAHVDAGKTTLTERILYFTGKSHVMGNVDKGNTVTDSSTQEIEKGITISSAAVSVNWKDYDINIIDTPGHIDFNIEVNHSLRVLDGAVVVFDAVAGVEPQTETNWRLADEYQVPRVCMVNKMDRVGADYYKVVEAIEKQLAVKALVLQIPIGSADEFVGLVDIVKMQAFIWSDASEGFEVSAIPQALLEQANEFRELLLYELAEFDDELMLDVLAGDAIDEATIKRVVRTATLSAQAVPVCCGAAFKNKGVEPLLDVVVNYLPAPEDKPNMTAMDSNENVQVSISCSADEPFSALAFKVVNDKHGALTYLRVYSGTLNLGDKVVNTAKDKVERIGRMFVMHAQKREAVETISAGDIVAVLGLKQTDTGDTLCDVARTVVLERIEAPIPVIDVAIEARSKQEQSKLAEAIRLIVAEDPSLRISTGECGETLLSGMGELHLEVVIARLQSDYGVVVKVGKPQVAYREALVKAVETSYSHKKQTGGPGQYAQICIRLEPIEGDEIEFESKIVGGVVPAEFIPAVEAGIRQAANNGVLGGYPLGGFKATLLDGDYHAQDSSQVAFKIAGAEAFAKAAKIAGVALLEPVMAVEVVAPQVCVGDCIGDLSRRRSKIGQQSFRASSVVLNATVPLSQMFGYIGDLRSLSAGRASFSMSFDHYEVVPNEIKTRVLDA